MYPVHVRIVDADTLQPLAVRLRVTDASGRSCVPLGRPAVFRLGPGEDVGGALRLGDEDWYPVDGGAEMLVPAGRVRVQAWHGLEYRPLDEVQDVKTGQLALRFRMQRWTDERTRGWYSGDVSAFEIDPFAALLEGRAEDLAIVQIAARERSEGQAVRVPNLVAFGGSSAVLERPGHQVAVGTFNQHPQLGALLLLGCHRPVFPLRFGLPDGRLDWSLVDCCDQAHRKKDGVVVWADEPADAEGELLVAALLGKIDAIEARIPILPVCDLWYALFDAGVRLALVGGSGKESNRVALGRVRTYARLLDGEELSYGAWLRAVWAGRTYFTSGPLLDLRTEPVEGGYVQVHVEARSVVAFEQLELLREGQVIEAATPSGDPLTARLVTRLPAEGWLAARCLGNQRVMAHTSPLWLSEPSKPFRRPARSLALLRLELQDTRRWAEQHPGPHDERFLRQLLDHLARVEQTLNDPSGSGE